MIGEVIEMTEKMERYDAACKVILSQKVVLSRVLKECLEEFHSLSIEDIMNRCIEYTSESGEVGSSPMIWGLRTEDVSLSEGKTSGDIRFSATTLDGQKIIFDIEAQNAFPTTYSLSKRGTYYLGRMITEQRGREFEKSHYEKLKKVVLIWICLKPPRTWRNAITIYEMTQENVVGDIVLDPKEYDLITQIIIGLGEPKKPDAVGVLGLLDILFSHQLSVDEKKRLLQESYDVEMDDEFERGVEEVCNFSIAIKQEALEEGMEKGIEQGMKQGLEQGIEKGLEKGILNVNLLYRTLTAEKRLDDLQKAINDDGYMRKLLKEYSLA